ncbi:DUF86 domain-containing protein [Planctomycetota bacterium]
MPREPKDDAAFLWDMLDSARAVQRFVAGVTIEAYRADRMLRSAVEREIEIIGEAARGVSSAFEAEHPEIPWKAIVAQRHVLAHEYGAVDNEAIYRVATVHVPELIERLVPLLPPPPDRPRTPEELTGPAP